MKKENLNGIDGFVKAIIKEGFYRYKSSKSATVMFNGEDYWSYTPFAKTRQLITGYKKDGSPKYLDLNTVDMNRSDFPIITKTVFDLNLPFGKVKDKPLINTAKLLKPEFPIKGKRNAQDTSIFWKHLEYLCGDVSPEIKEWVKDWVCDIFQNPENKKGTALIFIGEQGCGKNIFFYDLMSALLSEYYHYDCGKEYSDKYNLELRDRLLINFDEGFATKSKSSEAKLKSFITQPRLKIEGKGSNSVIVHNPARAVFTTNARFAMNTADDDRRFAIFRTVKKDFITPEYFVNFANAIENRDLLEKFMYELTTRKIKARLNIPPVTDEKESQQAFSADKVADWFNYIIATPRHFQEQLKDNSQSRFNSDGYFWSRYEDNERWIFKENALASFLNYRGNNEGIVSTNKLFSALKAFLEDHGEWSISNETKRINSKSGFIMNDKDQIQRVWVLTKKV
jgi:hypothetical protein